MLIPHRLLLYLYLIPPSQCYSKRGNECEDDLLYTDSASSIHTRCIICLSVKCLDVLFSVSMRCLIVAMFRLSRGSRHEACHRSHEPSPLQSGLNIRSRSRQVAATTCFSQGGSRGTERPAAQRWVNILKHPSSSRSTMGIFGNLAASFTSITPGIALKSAGCKKWIFLFFLKILNNYRQLFH